MAHNSEGLLHRVQPPAPGPPGPPGPPQDDRRPIIPVSFLLDVTDPASKSSTRVFASQDPDADIVPPSNAHPRCFWDEAVRSDDSQNTPVDLNSLFWGFDNPLGDLPFDSWVIAEPVDTPFAFSDDPNGDLQIRLNILASELMYLEKDVGGRCYRNVQLKGPTETDYRNLFTAARFLELVSTFFQRIHWQWPILHRATLDLHQACLPLLLSIILSGAAYSRPGDRTATYSASAEAFHNIAETYIFDHLDNVATASDLRVPPSNGTVEACQAALIIEIVLFSMNNSETRRRMLAKNHPSLVAVIRTTGLASIQQQQQQEQQHAHSLDMPSWDAFIRHESLVRVVTWVFLQDAVLTLFCNQPPAMAISEMVGDLPCSEELWAAESEVEFEAKRQQVRRLDVWQQPRSIRHLVAWLLDDEEWEGQQQTTAANTDRSSRCDRLSLSHLIMLIWALQPVLLSLRTTMLGTICSSAVTRALQRWRGLWDVAVEALDPARKTAPGTVKNVTELARLATKIVEVGGRAEAMGESRYLQGIPREDTADIHDFIRKYMNR